MRYRLGRAVSIRVLSFAVGLLLLSSCQRSAIEAQVDAQATEIAQLKMAVVVPTVPIASPTTGPSGKEMEALTMYLTEATAVLDEFNTVTSSATRLADLRANDVLAVRIEKLKRLSVVTGSSASKAGGKMALMSPPEIAMPLHVCIVDALDMTRRGSDLIETGVRMSDSQSVGRGGELLVSSGNKLNDCPQLVDAIKSQYR